MKNPCLSCQLGDKDKSGPVCMKCNARCFYVDTVPLLEEYTSKQKAAANKLLLKLIPTQTQINRIYTKIIEPTRSRPDGGNYAGTKPRLKLRTFRAFYHAAKREGFPGILGWFEGDYIKHRRNGKFMRDKAGCAAVTLYKMLEIYGMPQPATHNTYLTLAELDADRVGKMLDGGCTMADAAKDQGCSTGLINRFRQVTGRIKKKSGIK